MKTTTTTGTEVTLTGVEYCGMPTVKVELQHPTAGKVEFQSSTFGSPARSPAKGIIGHFGSQKICVTVPEADFDAAMAEARTIGEREIAALKSSEHKIQCRYQDGEYLSGHTVYGRAGQLLVELGLASEVEGWGTHVEGRVIDALGEEFTYAQAAELARPALEAKTAKKAEAHANREAKFTEARQTGQPVVLWSGMDECDGSVDDCSFDSVSQYAMPDGTTKTKRSHCH